MSARPWLLAAAALAGGALGACRDINPDHCLHKAEDADAWCSVNTTGTPFCSPCVADNHGCVADPPGEDGCPEAGSSSSSASAGG